MDEIMPDPYPYIPARRIWVTNLILRIFEIICNFTLLGLGDKLTSGRPQGTNVFIYLLPVSVPSLPWALLDAYALLSRQLRRERPPVVPMVLDLLIWMVIIPVLTLMYRDFIGELPLIPQRERLRMAILAIVGLLGATGRLFHFVNFVLACVEYCSRCNRKRRTGVEGTINALPPQGCDAESAPGVDCNQQHRSAPHRSYEPHIDAPQSPPQTYQQGSVKA
ncbi:hypothetical protein VTJ49DRAFT_6957 [Mycothermus thermophilus]|uniref:Uncharacterized protein n=1 Tax=Humicola insolens TaxID=85995 RepID=A0ABR3VIL1_HUMIN